jgi:hypothetical protein
VYDFVQARTSIYLLDFQFLGVPFQGVCFCSLALVVGTEMMGNSCTSARSAKPPQDTMEMPPSRCETKEQPIAWCPSSNRLNKEGNYAVSKIDAEGYAMALSTSTITLMDGWTTAHTEKLRAAVKDVVAANPSCPRCRHTRFYSQETYPTSSCLLRQERNTLLADGEM